MAITFRVDDVERAEKPLETKRLAEVMGEGALCVGGDPDLAVVPQPGVHPLIGAVHLAFSEHRPLVLTPDAVWLTIAQGVAQHVRLNAEKLRSRLVRHDGRERLTVKWNGPMPTVAAEWGTIVNAFRGLVAEHTGQGLARLFTCDFSTSTTIDLVASEIVLMDAVSPYFDFFLACVCGIPEVTLTGAVADWKRIRERVEVLAELDLQVWAKSLTVMCDQFVRTAEGNPDVEFWKSIYKPRRAYGWDRVTGWIARLFPYLQPQGRVDTLNPLLALPFDEPKGSDDDGWYAGPGVRLEDVPSGPSQVLLRVQDDVAGRRLEVQLEGGLMAVQQDGDGRLTPVAAYVIRPRVAGALDVIDRIQREHAHAPDGRKGRSDGTAEQLAFADRLGTATLKFSAGVWRLRGWKERDHVSLRVNDDWTATIERWVDLPGERFIGHLHESAKGVYVLCDASKVLPPEPPPPEGSIDDVTGLPYGKTIEVIPRQAKSTQPLSEVRVLGDSLAKVLEHALDHDGALEDSPPRAALDFVAEYKKRPRPPPPPRTHRG